MAALDLIGQIAGTGLMGVVATIALLALRAKDQQLTKEKDSRIQDARDYAAARDAAASASFLAMARLDHVAESLRALTGLITERIREQQDNERETREEEVKRLREKIRQTGPHRPILPQNTETDDGQ